MMGPPDQFATVTLAVRSNGASPISLTKSVAAAIIPIRAAAAQRLTATLASTFTATPVWRRRWPELRATLGERVDELPLLERRHVPPSRNLIAGAQATEAIARGAQDADVDAR